jgi:hypothetical protein
MEPALKNTKTRNHHHLVVRVFELLGSARLTDVRQVLRLRLPFVFRRLPRGKLYFTLDVDRLPSFLDVTPECISRLRSRFCPTVQSPPPRRPSKIRVDYIRLADEYCSLLSSGQCRNFADVARKIGKSRVWVSKVIRKSKGIRRTP